MRRRQTQNVNASCSAVSGPRLRIAFSSHGSPYPQFASVFQTCRNRPVTTTGTSGTGLFIVCLYYHSSNRAERSAPPRNRRRALRIPPAMTAFLWVSERASQHLDTLSLRSLLLTRLVLVRPTGPRPRREPCGLIVAAEDDPDALRPRQESSGAVPVLVLEDVRPLRDAPASHKVFRADVSTAEAVVQRFLFAVDPTIPLFDELLSQRATRRRPSAVDLRSQRDTRRPGTVDPLSHADLEALYLLLSGHASKEGATRLRISASAFDKRVARLHRVFRCASSQELITTVFWQCAAQIAARFATEPVAQPLGPSHSA